MQFDAIQELVSYYSSQSDAICTTLSAPCQLTEPPLTAELSRRTNKACEIEQGLFLLKTQLGGGQYCDVWEGVWNGTTGITVKIFKPGTVVPSEFQSEVAPMKHLRHTNEYLK